MGTVFLAEDERLGRLVALKLLRDSLAGDERLVERFRREARSAAALSHENIARVFDYGEEDGCHFIAMEYARGRDLARVLRDEGALEPARVASIGAQAAAALGHAHAAGVIHRDVKPANIMLDDNDHVKVTDFGIARANGETTLTATGALLGTALYLSPEQAAGEPAGSASDVYSLGIVLYELLTGAAPFTGESAVTVALRHMNEEVPAPSLLKPETPSRLDAVIAKATAKRPEDRYATGAELAVALGGTSGDAPVVASRLSGRAVAPTASAQAEATEVLPLPLPTHWDPKRVGKIVVGVFAALLLAIVALAAYRIANSQPASAVVDAPPAERSDAVAEPAEAPRPVRVTIPVLEGRPFKDVKDELQSLGLAVAEVKIPSGYAKDIVAASEPAAGARAREGDTVTVFVSEGPAEEDDDEDDDDHPGRSEGKGKGKGRDKHEEDD